MIRHYFTVAFRNLWKYKVQNLIGILGLAVGFVVFSICCYTIQRFLSIDSEYINADRIYRIKTESLSEIRGDMRSLPDNFSGIEKLTSSSWLPALEMIIPQKDNHLLTVSTALCEVDTSFINFFSVQLIKGNLHAVTGTANSIVLVESFARKWGEPAELVGTTVTIDETPWLITGIMKDFPKINTVMPGNGIVMNKTDGYYSRIHDTWNPAIQPSIYVMLRKRVSAKDMQRQFDT